MTISRRRTLTLAGSLLALLLGGRLARAEEGMWPLNNLPRELLQKKYGFAPDEQWLAHVRLASVRFQDGGSGSFVSPDGLVITNHHVAVGQLQKMSSAKKDYVRDGFYAARRDQEIPCVDQSLMVLQSMEDVTQRVLGVVKPGMTAEQAIKARRAERAAIEKESLTRTRLHSEVVSLYQGGEYWLHRYRKHKDVRLVMAPEKQAAFFGGDDDNFTYPRHDLDIAFFRVYEGGKPLRTKDFLRVNPKAGQSGELVFISGHPGSTERLMTVADLELSRDLILPEILGAFGRAQTALEAYSRLGAEQRRRAKTRLFGLANGLKALGGQLQGLKQPGVLAAKRAQEEALQAAINKDPALKKQYGGALQTVRRAVPLRQKAWRRAYYQDLRTRFSALTRNVVSLVLLAQEQGKPDGERMQGFHDSELEELKFYLFSKAPIYKDMEQAALAAWFTLVVEKLGKADPLVKAILALGNPTEAATRLTTGTAMDDAAARRKLFDGGLAAIEASTDPVVVLARKAAPLIRANEEHRKKVIDGALVPAREKLARARFAIHGRSVYPDATFTLRLTFGRIEGYPMNGTLAPPRTTLHGLFDRALGFEQKREFWLPGRFWQRKGRLELATPVNFVSSCDIIGGNSGSPVINRKGELVGVVFDGNIESLVGAFLYDGTANRSVSVHAAYVMEALDKLYDAKELAQELRR